MAGESDCAVVLNVRYVRDSTSFVFNVCLLAQTLYSQANLTGVFSDDDAIQEYEKQALAKSENLDGDKLLADSLQKLDHVKKLEVLQGEEDSGRYPPLLLIGSFVSLSLRHQRFQEIAR